MKHSTGNPTKADQERFRRIREGGCIACRLRGVGYVPPEIHHLTETGRHGGRRIGHSDTVGLCPWHHRGVSPDGIAWHQAALVMGPSLARTPREFRSEFGFDDELLAEQERVLGRMEGLRGV